MALAERRHAPSRHSRSASDDLGRHDPPSALLAARSAGGDAPALLHAWAEAHPARDDVDRAISRLATIVTLCVVALLLISLVAGYGAASAALATGVDGLVNVPAVLGVLLGLPTLALVLWLAVTLVLPRAASRLSIGGIVDWIVSRLFGLLGGAGGSARGGADAGGANDASRTDWAAVDGAAALDAVRRDEMSPRVVRWSFGALTHGAWFAFTFGAIVGLLVTFALRERQFSWESTILSHQQWEGSVRALGWLPSKLGFTMPDSAQIAAARFSPADPTAFVRQDDDSRRAWASLILFSIVAYSALPRCALLLFCGWRRRRALDSIPLAIDAPPLAQLLRTIDSGHDDAERRPAAMPSGTATGRLDLDSEPSATVGPPAIVGVEITPPSGGWPPSAASSATDLGIVEISRAARDALTHALRADPPPARLVIVVPLTMVPDRGVLALLSDAIAAARRPAHLVLTAGEALRARGDRDAVTRRIAIWIEAASDLGLPRTAVHEIDLDVLTARSGAALHALIEGTAPDRMTATDGGDARHLEAAFALIVEACDDWCAPTRSGPPSVKERALLAGRIAGLYRGSGGTPGKHLPAGFPTIEALRASPVTTLRDAAHRAEAMLPSALRLRPRWIGAGGMAGALACVGVAIATGGAGAGAVLLAAPYMAGLGAIAAQLVAPKAPRSVERDASLDPKSAESDAAGNPEPTKAEDVADAVMSATLHAIMLEAQGHGEAAITRGLDSALVGPDGPEPPVIASAADARRWLDGVRHRFGLALATGARP